MTEVRTAHTADLDAATLAAGRARRTPGKDGSIYVLPVGVALDVCGELTCDWRDGDLW
ncbi:MAG: aminoglycoside 2-N-acetyltransferase [Thermoleophilaceae bacterium]|nr:aminoglycoside 2-N-acetyltransferase [Thermoleophilaceae bacterium]